MASIAELLDKLKNARTTVELVDACGKRVCSSEEHWDCPYGNEGMTDCVDRLEAAYEDTIENLLLQLAEAIPAADVAPAVRWIPVAERLPENEQDVLIQFVRKYGRKVYRVVGMAFHTDGQTTTEDSDYAWQTDYIDMPYDEAKDAYIIPEGWWETVRFGEEFAAVDMPVTHWMPLPEPPEVVR